eukprot:5005522-Pyramimonas_sp.AAC.1
MATAAVAGAALKVACCPKSTARSAAGGRGSGGPFLMSSPCCVRQRFPTFFHCALPLGPAANIARKSVCLAVFHLINICLTCPAGADLLDYK